MVSSRLLGRIDHELKNPVMATNLALDALRAAPPGSPQATDAVEVIATQSARLGALLTSLRKIADVEHRDLDIEQVDLGELLTAVRDACSTTSNSPRTWRQVSWLMRSAPGGAFCSMRAAMFTAWPRMVPASSTPPPSSTGPVCTPARMAKLLSPYCCCAWVARRAVSARIAG